MKNNYVFSSGGGRQSSAALVLSAHKILPYGVHIFCNTGDDSEDAGTLKWVWQTLCPYADKNGIEFIVAHKNGKTLLESIKTTEYSIPIPARMYYENGKKNIGNRVCTNDWKIRVSDREIKNMYGNVDNPPDVHVGLGITVDEIQRAKTYPPRKMGASGEVEDGKKYFWTKHQEYPLIFNEPFELFGRKFKSGLTAADCSWIVEQEGLGTPPKSACWFCPYRHVDYWRELKVKDPALFYDGVEIEQLLQEKEERMKKKHLEEGKEFHDFKVFLTDTKLPLIDIDEMEKPAFDENCESGYCMI